MGTSYIECGRRNQVDGDLRARTGEEFEGAQERLLWFLGDPQPCRLDAAGVVRLEDGTAIAEVTPHYERDHATAAYDHKKRKRIKGRFKALEGLLWYGSETSAFPAGSIPSWVPEAQRKNARLPPNPLSTASGRSNIEND